MPLSNTQKKHLKSLAHKLDPVVLIGQHGISENLLTELDIALSRHELLKVKLSVGDRELRDAMIAELCTQSQAELVQRIGNIAVLFRRNPERQKIELPA